MPSSVRRVRRSRSGPRALVASLIAILGIGILGAIPAIAASSLPGPGFKDFQYKPLADGTGANDVTSERNQSKLWFNDGRWWGILFDKGTTADGTYRIQSLNMATQAWTTSSTATPVDNRNRSKADVLWDGTNLWVVSGHDHGRNWTPSGDVRLYKFAYNATTKAYSAVSGFPKLLATNGADPGAPAAAAGTMGATIAKAPNGSVWIAYMQRVTPGTGTAPANVKVVHVSSAGAILSGPMIIPGQGVAPTTDDMAAITSVGNNGVGVLWSNQTAGEEAFYFAAHADADADVTWGTRETAFGGSGTATADGHISVKTDSGGRVIAAVKTSRVTGTDPLIDVIARTGNANVAGTWSNRIVSSVSQNGTRPVLVLDSENDQANVFITATAAGVNNYFITRRTASLSNLSFGGAAIGTKFIDGNGNTPDNGAINNSTSTKQITSAASGIIVLASDIPNRYYLHGCAGAVCPVVPVAAFTGTPLTGEGPLPVQFTDTSTGTPGTWAWTFGDGATSALQNPSHTFNPGSWTVSLTVTNALGTNTVTKTNYVVVSVPAGATYTAIDPVRMLDTRVANGLTGKFVSATPRSFQVTGRLGIPADAVAVTGNLSVVNQSKAGYVFLGPTASSTPTSSTLNFPTGDVRGNAVTVALDGTGQLGAVYMGSPGATTNLILDVTGYFVRDTAGSTYKAGDPARILDTRVGTGLSGKFVDSTPRSFQVTGSGGVPAGAVAVTGNLSVVNQSKAGYVFLGPTASSTPTSSTLNFPTGDIRGNAVTVALDGTGKLGAVYKGGPGATTNLIFDVTGYFLHDLSGARYIALEPVRLLDTRVANGLTGKFVSSTPRNFDVAGRGGVPSNGVAITGNLSVVNQSKAGYVFLGPTASATPTASTLNFPKGDVRGNAVTVALNGTTGGLGAVYKSAAGATTDLILDVTGYFK